MVCLESITFIGLKFTLILYVWCQLSNHTGNSFTNTYWSDPNCVDTNHRVGIFFKNNNKFFLCSPCQFDQQSHHKCMGNYQSLDLSVICCFQRLSLVADVQKNIVCRRHFHSYLNMATFPARDLLELTGQQLLGAENHLVISSARHLSWKLGVKNIRRVTADEKKRKRWPAAKFSWQKIYRYRLGLIIVLFEGYNLKQDKCSSHIRYTKSITGTQSGSCRLTTQVISTY